MKRHPGLHALSQHHHFALIESLQIRRASEQPGPRREAAMRELAAKFLRFWERAGSVHFREEEEILLPAYRRHAAIDNDPDVTQMLADHSVIRASVAKLDALLQSGESVEAELVELGERLRAQIRLEEDRIFPAIESAVPDVELSSLAQRLTRLHSKDHCEF